MNDVIENKVNEQFKLEDRKICELSDFAIKFDSFDKREKIEIIDVPVYNEMHVLQVESNGKPVMEKKPINIREELENLIFLAAEFGFQKSKIGDKIKLSYEECIVEVYISEGNPKMTVNADSLWDLVQKKAMELKQKRG